MTTSEQASNSARAGIREWIMVAAAIMLAAVLLVFGRGSIGARERAMPISITVVPSDADHLSCRGSLQLDGARCLYDAADRMVAAGAPLRPFMTVQRQIVLLTGVFEEPHVAEWLAQARSAGTVGRVTVDCIVRKLGVAGSVGIRWATQSPWSTEHDLEVARISTCTVH